MRTEYDLTKLKGHRNPYAKALKRQITIRLGTDVLAYFKSMADTMGVPYQSLINLYLKDCAERHRRLSWAA
ncbi:MAG: antitoxin [Omnitrophica WOR_2 bacterium RIFCSPHIGHO2_02_FULL_68_15]|nr:MAG: antitoxin [Omnitrophica WOR_2 bacterium RIFCSPHIGHO2_02_FULL_68_15]